LYQYFKINKYRNFCIKLDANGTIELQIYNWTGMVETEPKCYKVRE
jgi:hypothetical protein